MLWKCETVVAKYNEIISIEELKLFTHVTLHGLHYINASITFNYCVHSDDEKKKWANILEEMIL